jgi:pilus assembly protein CpaB
MGAFALAAAIAAGFLAQNWLSSQRAQLEAALAARTPVVEEADPAVEVLIAAETLPTGTFLKADYIKWVPFPEEAVSDAYFVRETFEEGMLDGAVARASLAAGEPITQAKVVRPGERGFLAAVLKPGTRAVSVPINATTGISGFVFPGDAVDLLLTATIKQGQRERRVTETVLSDLRVLAVDQRTNDQEGEPALAKTATLEVLPKQAEVIAVAMEIGRLSLALRSLAVGEGQGSETALVDSDQALARFTSFTETERESGGPSVTWDDQAASFFQGLRAPATGGAAPAPPPPVTVRIVRRGEAETQSFEATR